MPRPPRDDAAAKETAKAIIARSTCVEEVRAAQAFLLPLMGLSLDQTAEILGKDRFWVSRTRNRFLRGEPLGTTHGGRRNAYLSPEQEREVIRDALAEYCSLGFRAGRSRDTDVRGLVCTRLDGLLHRPANESTITEMLDRYANRIVPGAKWSDFKNFHWQLALLAELELSYRAIREHGEVRRSLKKN